MSSKLTQLNFQSPVHLTKSICNARRDGLSNQMVGMDEIDSFVIMIMCKQLLQGASYIEFS